MSIRSYQAGLTHEELMAINNNHNGSWTDKQLDKAIRPRMLVVFVCDLVHAALLVTCRTRGCVFNLLRFVLLCSLNYSLFLGGLRLS